MPYTFPKTFTKALNQSTRLRIAISLSLTSLAILAAISFWGYVTKTVPLIPNWAALLFIGATSMVTYLLHKRVKGSLYALVILILLLTGMVVYSLGSIMVPASSVFLVIIVISAFLLGSPGIVFSTLLSILIIFVITYAEVNHLILPQLEQSTYLQSFFYLIIFFFTAIISYFIIHQLEISTMELKKLHQVVEQSPISVLITNTDGVINYVNAGFTNVTGYTSSEVLGKNPRILRSGTKTLEEYQELYKTIGSGKEWRGEFTNIRKDGTVYYESSLITPIMDDKNNIINYVAIKEDITKRKLAEEGLLQANRSLAKRLDEIESLQNELRSQALRDPLTGLYNRRYLDDMIEKELDRAQRAKTELSVIIIDIDLFKKINDAFGHKTGDLVLVAMAKFLESAVRSSDFCCRFGGEEFVLVLPTASLDIALERAENLRLTLQNLKIDNGDKPIQITASFGVASYPKHAQNSQDLLSRADQALYRAKEQGRNRVCVWN